MGGIWQLPVSFDVLDAATQRCIGGYVATAPAWRPEREQVTTASVVYYLRCDDLGDLGAVYLDKLSDKLTELRIESPPHLRKPEAEWLHRVVIDAFLDRLSHESIWLGTAPKAKPRHNAKVNRADCVARLQRGAQAKYLAKLYGVTPNRIYQIAREEGIRGRGVKAS
jgi:hypothetical protein